MPTKIDHLRVFGCLCYASNLSKGDTFSQRARKTVLMRYSTTQKGYRIYDLQTKSFIMSRDVTFREHVFLFKELVSDLNELFPLQSSISQKPNEALLKNNVQHSEQVDAVLPQVEAGVPGSIYTTSDSAQST